MIPAKGTVVVVGASSGIGEALARRLAHEARPVAILARREEELERVVSEINAKVGTTRAHGYVHDAAITAEVTPILDRIEQDLGLVDELHYVAGVMPPVEEDEYPTDKDALQVQVNLIGCIAWCNAVAPRFIERKSGHIIGVGSVAGDRGRVGKPGYHASKAGQDTFLESMRNRLWRHGVYTTTIRPGFVETPMTADIELKGAITADKAAELIIKARNRKSTVAYVPIKWWLIMTIVKSIPSFIFRKLSI